MTATAYITIDGTVHYVPIPTGGISRTFSILDKSAERDATGTLHREPIGTFENCKLTFASPTTSTEAAALAAMCVVMTAPVASHSVIIPGINGGTAFDAYFAEASDELRSFFDIGAFWDNFTVNVIAISPQRTA